MKKDLLFLIGVVLLILGLGIFFMYSPKAPELAYAPVDVGGGSIIVEDQNQLDFVEFEVELAKPGFVTIHKTMSDAPTEIIATTDYLELGTHEIKIYVTEEMLPGYKYAALLHVDNGNKVFDAQLDFPVLTNGEVVRPYFLAIPEAERIEIPE